MKIIVFFVMISSCIFGQDTLKVTNVLPESFSTYASVNQELEIDFNIPLDANTSHIFVPVWTDLTISQLTVLVDIGNDGTIDDTLYLNNTVSVEEQGFLGIPKEFNLSQNYPNPFNPVTRIRYSIPQTSFVTIKVYDILGSEVATLINEEKPAGNYEVEFQAESLPSGVYLYKLQTGSFVATKKMLLLK